MTPIANIREHMRVLGSDGSTVGVVDGIEGTDRIKLTKADSPDGQHHFIDGALVARVDSEVHLSKTADAVIDEWDEETDLELEHDEPTEIDRPAAQRDKEWADRRR